MIRPIASVLLCSTLTGVLWAPPHAEFSGSRLIDAAIQDAIRADKIPGAVVLVGKPGAVLHHEAYGSRSSDPAREAMTKETIFDAASLTKVVATTSAIMKLFEEGKVRLNDKVTEYIPEFQGGKSNITVRQLLTHFSGLRPDVDLKPVWSGYKTGIRLAVIDKPVAPPGTKFIYSDINFVLLAEIVQRVSGKTLPEYVKDTVFQPLGMKDTMFQPPATLWARVAPTERVNGSILRGVVHDPTARYMGGVAGHAGLFSTAEDLSKFAEMMVNMGERNGVRIFSPATVMKFTTPQSPANQPILRGLGWDIDSPFSGTRGELFPLGSYGHTGFTGTSLWIDPVSKTYVVILSNSGHPRLRAPITSLRSRIATITAASLGMAAPGIQITGYNETLVGAGLHREIGRNAQAFTGLDALVNERFKTFAGKRVGIITNHTGLDRNGVRSIDKMREAGVQVTAIYSPEHGIAGQDDHENIGHSKDATTGIPVWSLYSAKGRRPTAEMLANIDILVFDIQDIGTRFYTYITTMGFAMEEAAKRKIPFFVLDRPNPITGVRLEGPILDPALTSFIGYFPMPLRHGMTVGEMARMFNEEKKIGADLRVVLMENWERGDWFDSTGLVWVDPSPNMRSLGAALLYPGVAMLEFANNYSVGRGTEAPFEMVGADWIQGRKLAAYLNGRQIPGIRVYPVRFRPTASNFQNKTIEGVRFVITSRTDLDSSRLGLELAGALVALYPGKIDLAASEKLIGNRAVIEALKTGEDPRRIHANMQEDLDKFAAIRARYLLY